MTTLQEEIANLRLQVNAGQQVQAQLELQLRQKDEIIIKMQNENDRLKQENEETKTKLEQKTIDADKIDQVKNLEDTITLLQVNINKLKTELSEKQHYEQKIKTTVDEYEVALSGCLTEMEKSNKELLTVKRHLANTEFAFSDVHQKYESCKNVIDGFKSNESTLIDKLSQSAEYNINLQDKYEALKSHAMTQIERANKDLNSMKNAFETEALKQTGQIKCLEIKLNSMQQLLDQKNKECAELSALLNELTGSN